MINQRLLFLTLLTNTTVTVVLAGARRGSAPPFLPKARAAAGQPKRIVKRQSTTLPDQDHVFADKDSVCSCCMEDVGKGFMALRCGHAICPDCLVHVLRIAGDANNKCPVCRAKIHRNAEKTNLGFRDQFSCLYNAANGGDTPDWKAVVMKDVRESGASAFGDIGVFTKNSDERKGSEEVCGEAVRRLRKSSELEEAEQAQLARLYANGRCKSGPLRSSSQIMPACSDVSSSSSGNSDISTLLIDINWAIRRNIFASLARGTQQHAT